MLNISIVLYRPAWEQEVLPLVQELLRVKNLRKIYLLDNSEKEWLREQIKSQQSPFDSKKVRYMAMPSNLGYGTAHNVALRESAYYKTELHLVMNSDIRVKAEDEQRHPRKGRRHRCDARLDDRQPAGGIADAEGNKSGRLTAVFSQTVAESAGCVRSPLLACRIDGASQPAV